MAVFARRTNRLMDPFNEKVRARIFGISNSVSSESEHDGVDSSSPCLSHLVQNFLEDESRAFEMPSAAAVDFQALNSDSEDESVRSDLPGFDDDVIGAAVWNNAEQFRDDLLAHVTKAVEMFCVFKSSKTIFNRNIMAYLRDIGYNAGICKTKWNSSPGGSLCAGNYEFVDVIKSEESVRYFIDADFAGQFEIARETENYSRLQKALPRVFVGRGENLKRIVKVMCDEARRSMKSNALSLPPWRKNRYMQAKWFGPYRRTVCHLPSSSPTKPVIPKITVICRPVEFDTAVDGGRLSAPPATRTR
ncbi:hypothetical protein Nepgr_029788 [Nepenthes gracilis]|uniref:DUF506 family protein n=1 Tax=Nepenthes gracilis TaxID=150966 RepID=A0AAD3Y568_NEPGR|nr:hypothetical protein Nepgr_029788 [Nepenthes gracilis]